MVIQIGSSLPSWTPNYLFHTTNKDFVNLLQEKETAFNSFSVLLVSGLHFIHFEHIFRRPCYHSCCCCHSNLVTWSPYVALVFSRPRIETLKNVLVLLNIMKCCKSYCSYWSCTPTINVLTHVVFLLL